MNRIRTVCAVAYLGIVLAAAACAGGPIPEEVPSPTATGIPSPLPASYAWVRAQLDGELRGEFVTGDPQDTFERIRGRVEGDELVVEIGFDSRNIRFRTPPLRGGSRYVLGRGEGELVLTIDGVEWSTSAGGVCSVIFGHVRGPHIAFLVPEGARVFEADAGFVCAALESRAQPGSVLSVIDGSLHFFFVVPSGMGEAGNGDETSQRTSTATIPPTG